jgi:hypothetical protein
MSTDSQNTGNPGASLTAALMRAFTEHPEAAGETYGAHLRFTLRVAGQLLACCCLMVIHGLLPFLFTHAASDRFQACVSEIDRRRRSQGLPCSSAANDLDSDAAAYTPKKYN